jgi:hypothetical protein
MEQGRTGAVQHHDILHKGEGMLASDAHKEGSHIPTYTSTHTNPVVGGTDNSNTTHSDSRVERLPDTNWSEQSLNMQGAHQQAGGVNEYNTSTTSPQSTDTGAFDANRQMHERAAVDPSSGAGLGHGVSNTTGNTHGTGVTDSHHDKTGTGPDKTGTGPSGMDKLVGKTQQAIGKALKKPDVIEKGELRATEGKKALT